MASCPACGQDVEPDDNFCGHCGRRLVDTEDTQVVEPATQDDDHGVEAEEPEGGADIDADRTGRLVPVPDRLDEPAAPPPAPRMDDTPPVPPDAPSARAPDTAPGAMPDDTPPVPGPTATPAAGPGDDMRDDTGEMEAVATEDSPPGSTALFSAHPAASPNGGSPDPTDRDHAPAEAGDHTEVVSESGGVDLATCPECEAINAIQRSRCARCGAALHGRIDTDEDDYELQELPSESAVAAPAAAPAAPQRRRTRRTGLVIVALGIIVGGLIGTAFALGLGPFERGDVLAVEFDSEHYTSQPDQLSATSVESSEVRADEGGRSFGPTRLVDGDTTTAWIATDPDRARLVFHFDAPVWITSIEVANGDQHDDESFDATARVRTLLVDMDHGSMLRATLLDGRGRQVIRPRTPVLTDRIAFEVVNVTDGDGVGISEFEFVGHVANESDASAYRDVT